MKTPCQFGLWESPITPGGLAQARTLDSAQWDNDGQTLVWLEGRSGRGVLVAERSGGEAPVDLTTELSVRAEVGYGGGDFTVQGGYVYFVVHKTGRLYRQALAGGTAEPITPRFGQAASPAVSPDGKWIVYVHCDDEQADRLAIAPADGEGWPQVLAEGHDFYMQPRWSPDGRHVAWIAWDHPNMPWDGTLLYVAEVQRGGDGLAVVAGTPKVIAGGAETAVFQPEFTPEGTQLLFVSDESGWGRMGAYDLESGKSRWLTEDGADYAIPAWKQDMRTYAVTGDGATVVAACNQDGCHRLQRIDLATGEAAAIEQLAAYNDVTYLHAAPGGNHIALIGSSSKVPPRLVEYDLLSGAARVVARGWSETVGPESLADCEAISWRSAGGEEAHGLYYRPASARFEGSGKPPLIALIHGGPTSQYRAGWRPEVQFFATRGYAVLVVNYRGSTGYGREYMLKLRGNWGICDVEDSLSGMRHLIEKGEVDPDRTVIMGGSAGGFTVLQTMAHHPEAFTAGVNLYGVADQFHLAAETHKFESRYLDTMLGPLPEASKVYRERSPVFHSENIRRPLAMFQGEIDRVVPREQSDAIARALEKSGTPHVYHVYEGEGHGWRRRDTIEHFYSAVEEFLRKHVLFT